MTQCRAGTSPAWAQGRLGRELQALAAEKHHTGWLCVCPCGDPSGNVLGFPPLVPLPGECSVSAQAQLSPWTTQPDSHELAILPAQQKMLLITYKRSSDQGRVFPSSELTADRQPPLPGASLELGDPLTPTVATAPPGWKPLLLPQVQAEVHTAPIPSGGVNLF